MPKPLTTEEINEVKNWLQSLEVNYKNLHRDFSDALLLANLLKKFYPKIVELHNYPPRNNTLLKLNNWMTFNTKVLSKIGLHQNARMLEKFSKGVPGAIEALLFDIMIMIRSKKNKDDKHDEEEKFWTENDVMMVTANKMIGDAIVKVPQKMILFSSYEQILRESNAKDGIIASAQQKIRHLENILKLKDERIDDLCEQMAKLSVRSLFSQHNIEHSVNNLGTISEPNTIRIKETTNTSDCVNNS